MLRQFRAQILERFLSMRLNGVRTAQIFRHKWAKESLNRAINICTPGLRSILYVSSQEIAALSKGASHDDRHMHRISLTRLACHARSRCDDRCLDQDAACRLGVQKPTWRSDRGKSALHLSSGHLVTASPCGNCHQQSFKRTEQRSGRLSQTVKQRCRRALCSPSQLRVP